MISLMLVDDHAMLREGLRRKFEDCGTVRIVDEAGSGAELMEALARNHVDVIILDVKLPDDTGFALIPKVKAKTKAKIILLTMYSHVRYVMHALEAGADGFVVKGAPFDELLRAVNAVTDGRTYVCEEMTTQLMGRFRSVRKETPMDSLSEREFEVLTMLSSGLSLKEVGTRMGISDKTVSTYQTRLMEKLDLTSKADLVRFAIESGLVE